MVLLGAVPGVVGTTVTLGDAAKGGVDWVLGKLRDRDTDTVQISAEQLAVEGTLSLPLESIEDVGLTVKMLTMHLWIVTRTPEGEMREYTFSDQLTMPDGRLWEQAIPAARTALMAG